MAAETHYCAECGEYWPCSVANQPKQYRGEIAAKHVRGSPILRSAMGEIEEKLRVLEEKEKRYKELLKTAQAQLTISERAYRRLRNGMRLLLTDEE